ncbi:MAG: diaminopimelate decarboxylase [Verrucomicrobiota bacterium]
MEFPSYLEPQLLTQINDLEGSPCFLYDAGEILKQTEVVKRFPAPFGLFPRYAMKACPTRAILQLIASEGFGIDASSGYEVDRALRAGIAAEKISLSTQELPSDFADWVKAGVQINACSLYQLERYGSVFPGTRIGLRFNPGLGSGGTAKTNVGGPSSSFGIWHEKVEEVRETIERHSLTAFRIHTHIGSGSDPSVWQRTAELSLALVREFPTVTTLNLGGGYKVARIPTENGADIVQIGEPVAEALREFAAETKREIQLEVEPGTYLVANASFLIAKVQDIVDTLPGGHRFLKLNTGMTDLLRPSLYAAQHPMKIIPKTHEKRGEQNYVVVGHCCESGDLLSPSPADAETLAERTLTEARIDDWLIIGGVGAYCSSMSTKNYNSFPETPEILRETDGELRVIRKRQSLEQILANES